MDYVNEQTRRTQQRRKQRQLNWYARNIGSQVPTNQKFFNIENKLTKTFRFYENQSKPKCRKNHKKTMRQSKTVSLKNYKPLDLDRFDKKK